MGEFVNNIEVASFSIILENPGVAERRIERVIVDLRVAFRHLIALDA